MPKQYFLTELEATPLGPLGLAGSRDGLARISLFGMPGLVRENWAGIPMPCEQVIDRRQQGDPAIDCLADAILQLGEYLAGKRREFNLALDLDGISPARLEILKACHAIPFGGLRTYGQLAAELGRPQAAILVGGAMAANPLPLVIPCHRVVGADRRLHGFGAPGGIATKAWLLEMEGHHIVDQKLV